jgi:hypothetical protein
MFVGYKGIQGAYRELWKSGTGSAEESGIVRRHPQGRVEPSRGLEDPNLPLAAPTGVLLAPASPELVEGVFYKLLRLWVFCEVLYSPGPMWQASYVVLGIRCSAHIHSQRC